MTEQQTESPEDDLMLFLWQAWPWLAWLLPPALVLLRLGSGGWEAITLIVTFPIWWPTVALLALLPKFVLRKRGFTALPVTVGIAGFCVMLGIAAGLLSLRATGDSGDSDSPLRTAIDMSSRAELIVFLAAAMLLALGCLVTLVGSFVLRRPMSAAQRNETPLKNQRRRSPERRLGVGILIVLIMFPLAVTVVSLSFMFGASDGAGDREVDVAWLSPDEARARQELHWDEAQKDLQSTRRAISREHWLVGTYVGMNGEDEANTSKDLRYRAWVAWDLLREGSPEVVGEELLAKVESQGWVLRPDNSDPWNVQPAFETMEDREGTVTGVRYNFKNAKSQLLELSVSRPTAELQRPVQQFYPNGERYSDQLVVTLSFRSNWYWLEGGENETYNVVDWQQLVEDDKADALEEGPFEFSYDEWPELSFIETQPLTVEDR